MLTVTMLSLTRSIALRVPSVTFRSTAPIILQRSPFVPSLSTYRAFSTSPSLFSAAVKASTSETAGRIKAQPKTKGKTNPKTKVKPKTKTKPKAKAKSKPKRKVAAKSKPKVSTRVPEVLRPPKRPPTAFVLFYNRAYPSPGSRPGGITATSKEAGEAWHKLPDIEKQTFNDEAKSLWAEYMIQRNKWYKNPENLQVLKTLNKDRKKHGKKRILAPPTDAPKRPLTAFIRFAQELRDTNQLSAKDAPVGTSGSRLIWAARESGTRWNALPASEKEKYTQSYLSDMAKWKAANASASA